MEHADSMDLPSADQHGVIERMAEQRREIGLATSDRRKSYFLRRHSQRRVQTETARPMPFSLAFHGRGRMLKEAAAPLP